jgi:hypothetical protein
MSIAGLEDAAACLDALAADEIPDRARLIAAALTLDTLVFWSETSPRHSGCSHRPSRPCNLVPKSCTSNATLRFSTVTGTWRRKSPMSPNAPKRPEVYAPDKQLEEDWLYNP